MRLTQTTRIEQLWIIRREEDLLYKMRLRVRRINHQGECLYTDEKSHL